ncbi:hypothetical protein PbB2_02931 [Candidatus Phycosocius bacilliformis]|uniref:Uncharacterized protein n=1 Tax=Candidatus Phycosocius bacilliformis TaxID=1445552 RepID=A0A2P2EDU6_9PROT|nr:hypothetical protein [Candidatus Phycosocius bacilliformis]GBF59239.1 hypothetical protein PbB2_02931 [Candidatus Phycosocius bacilliformis]
MVVAAWMRSYYAPIEPVPRAATLDLRQDKSTPGRIITIIATKPTPSKGDFIGHLWLEWPDTPPLAKPGTREAGYYAHDQLEAIRAMAAALILPWGAVTGQDFVPGLMKVDDGWWRHLQVHVRVDEARYQAALVVDRRWRGETRYRLRPALIGPDRGKTFGCQDYVFDVAQALGLDTSQRGWTEFPMGSFLHFARVNKIAIVGQVEKH